jgi:hypothetical protein
LEVVGNSLKLFYGGTLRAFANDNSLTSGSMGMIGSQGVKLDDFTAAAITTTNATIPYAANTFTAADGTQLTSEWTNRMGNFSVASNAAQGKGALNLATLNGVSKTDIQIDANVNVLSGAGVQYAGVMGRYTGPDFSNTYMGWIVTLDGGATYQAMILKNVNGNWTVVSQANVSSGAGYLRFKLTGSKLELYYGANVGSLSLVAFAYDNSPLTAGTVGMIASMGSSLDNFSAQ